MTATYSREEYISLFLASLFKSQLNKRNQYVRTIINILDNLWSEIKNILTEEKPNNTIDRTINSNEGI